jgi:hypothetical protein
VNPWISAAASLIAAIIGGTIAILGVSRTLRSQVRLQDRAYIATISRELAGRLVAVEIALDSYTATRSDTDRGELASALDDLLPQARVVGLTVPAGSLRDKFDAVSTACSSYRKRLRQPQDPSVGAAETAARKAMHAAVEAIQARFSNAEDRH